MILKKHLKIWQKCGRFSLYVGVAATSGNKLYVIFSFWDQGFHTDKANSTRLAIHESIYLLHTSQRI